MLSPRRTKFRKQQRGRMQGLATRGATLTSAILVSKLKSQPGLPHVKLKLVVER